MTTATPKVVSFEPTAPSENPRCATLRASIPTGEKGLLVIKNGSTTGTTVDRVNGLESFGRVYEDYDASHKSL